jgi:hypothetical protein
LKMYSRSRGVGDISISLSSILRFDLLPRRPPYSDLFKLVSSDFLRVFLGFFKKFKTASEFRIGNILHSSSFFRSLQFCSQYHFSLQTSSKPLGSCENSPGLFRIL